MRQPAPPAQNQIGHVRVRADSEGRGVDATRPRTRRFRDEVPGRGPAILGDVQGPRTGKAGKSHTRSRPIDIAPQVDDVVDVHVVGH